MTTLNDRAAEAMLAAGAHAATDITGFGLLGHSENVARASRVRLIFDSPAVPFMKRVLELIAAGIVPGGTRHNAQTHATFTDFAPSVPEEVRIGLSDAQNLGRIAHQHRTRESCDARSRIKRPQHDGCGRW